MNVIVQLGLAAHKKAPEKIYSFFIICFLFLCAKTEFLKLRKSFLMGVRAKFMDFSILVSPIIGAGVVDIE